MVKKIKSTKTIDQKIDTLAYVVTAGFEQIDQQFKVIFDQMEILRSDVSDVKTVLGPLVHMAGSQEREIENLKLRLNRIERKVGFQTR